jgi:ADP-ribosylation factor-binding protein GGA
MEEEERAAQSAKLQELIRRGGPGDLQEANKLMKVMAGYDTRNKTDWRAKAAEEVGGIQQKARLLEDMLQKHQPTDKIKEGDVFEVSLACMADLIVTHVPTGTCECLDERPSKDSKNV